MASSLIGISVILALRNPPNTVVQGRVAHVNPETATLTLQNVLFPATGHRLDNYTVEGASIADIKIQELPPSQQHIPPPQQVLRQTVPPPQNTASFPQYQQYNAQPIPTPLVQQKQNFVDPAILSVGRRPSNPPPPSQPMSSIPQEAPATPIKPINTATAAQIPSNTSPFIGNAKERNPRKPSAATLNAPFSTIDIAEAGEPDSDEPTIKDASVRRASITKTRNGRPMEDPVSAQKQSEAAAKQEETWKRTRRGGKARRKELAAQERRNGADVSSPEAVRKERGTGWRQTPLLQAPNQENDPTRGGQQQRTPGVIDGRVGQEAANASNRKNRRQKALEATNGWATEDATDIQELPEFDFAENLSKFDKRSVFNQIRNEDTTADEDRLVSHNRLPARPGTHGGKNLHPTENVLDNRRAKTASESDTEDLSDFGSGRNSRRAMSRASAKRLPTRQGSGVQPDIDNLSHSGAPPSLLSRGTRTLISRPYATSSHATGSPKPARGSSPQGSPFPDTGSTRSSCLRIVSSNRKCNTITPGGMLAVEESAEIDFGLTEDIMAENAGRGIAEVALSAINPGGRRLARENPNARPVVVVLAGNHRGGARAVAAARHLYERGIRVMVALLGADRPADWDKDVRRQVDLFRKLGGWVRTWGEVETALKKLEAPPELIVDALLGRHREFDALGDADRGTVLSIVGWANKSRAAVLAVETPSGVAGSTGEVAILEGEPLEVRAKYIVCLGAPRTGLLRALQNGAGREPEWLIWIVDIGVNKPWRAAGGKGAKGVQFGGEWVVQVAFVEGEEVGV
ncbi:YjeF N-terminal domain-like protein [Mytilinidion resinicola]|uniref:Enhancer of mRNA-decapping protein 3 n=1 Tax=Mytilinidion resinicola TaxID=574789 RepID=A0A6A6ZBP5_9PEZI|nr:YjeF N-terminal domain-like protein [Mytilinidion resinicola]KAF2817735.1 YjeF N-terminal domain-like protein [Mytilinidion resinicola]